MEKTSKKIWFDTDIGSDVDDALALSFLANLHKKSQILLSGISTSYGPTKERARAAITLLRRLELPLVPVYAGSDKPLSNQNLVWFTGLESDNADNVNTYPLRVSKLNFTERFNFLITGPATNLVYFLKNESFRHYCQRIVFMGGSFQEHFDAPAIENNIEGDPKAVQAMLKQDIIPITLIPIDLTLKYPLSLMAMELIRLSSNEAIKLLQIWLTNWLEFTKFFPTNSPFREKVYLHDPIAAAYLIWPELFVTEMRMVEVLDSGKLIENVRGRSIEVCKDFDQKILEEIEWLIVHQDKKSPQSY